jgi:hypothetical protein
MGRQKVGENVKKIRVSITIDPIIEKIIKERYINLSSLTNNLLKNYFNEKESKIK